MADSGVVNIHGKEYKTVARRIDEFRKKYESYTISNEIIDNTDDIVLMKTSILNDEGRLLATGFAEEKKGSTNINKSSAIENCETSACGRALSFLGFAGSEIASADEITKAHLEQERFSGIELGIAIERHKDTIEAVKTGIATDDLSSAVEAYYELERDEIKSIWVAPSRGGPFSTAERKVIKESNEWSAAVKEHFGKKDDV